MAEHADLFGDAVEDVLRGASPASWPRPSGSLVRRSLSRGASR